MRRRHRRRSTWFPILGFENIGAASVGLSTVDVRHFTVAANGAPNVTVIGIIPDIDVQPELSQNQDGEVVRSLRDFVEGQSCIIDRITGSVQWAFDITGSGGGNPLGEVICCTAIAVVPTSDDGTGNPAVAATELDPLRADNSSQPWYWRRVWVLSDPNARNSSQQSSFPANNSFGSAWDGPKLDTNGVKRAIRREERIFLIHSVLALDPSAESNSAQVTVAADLRVVGHMVKARNKSAFK